MTGLDSETTVPPHVASGDLARERCNTEKPTPEGFYTCTAEAGHDGPHAAYSSADHLCDTWPRDEAADRAAALAGTGLVVPSAPAPRLYTCPDCGGHGTQPTHARDCARLSAAHAWASAGVVVAREGVALYDAGNLCDGNKAQQAGYLSEMLRYALEEIDKAAGA